MPLDNVENEVVLDTEVETPDPALKERIQSLEQTSQATQGYARLLADPDIRAVMDAKQSGRKIKVIPLSSDGNPEVPVHVASTTVEDKEPDYETASPKEINAYFMKKMMSEVGTMVSKTIEAKIQPLNEALGELSAERNQTKAKGIAEQVKAMRVKFKDFDQYANAMVELDKQANGSLSVQELYETSKRRAGHPLTAPRETQSERPTHASARPPAKPAPKGNGTAIAERNASFRSILRAAAEKAVNSPDEVVDPNEEEG